DQERSGQTSRRGVIGVLDDDAPVADERVRFELASEQANIPRPGVESVAGRMCTEESISRAHECQKLRLFARTKPQLAGSVEEHYAMCLRQASGREFARLLEELEAITAGSAVEVPQELLGG